jgi:hypothetical protein
MELTSVGLADAGAARDDDHSFGENRLQRLALAGRKRLVRSLLAPCNRLLKVDGRIERLPFRQTPDPCRNSLFRFSEMGQEGQRLALDLFEQQGAACSTVACGTSSSFTAASFSFAKGTAQWPSEVASSKP